MGNIYNSDIMLSYRKLLSGCLIVQEYYGIANPLPTIDELNNPKKFQLVKAGVYPPDGVYIPKQTDSIVTLTMLMPKGNIPKLKNDMGTNFIYSVSKNGKMIDDVSTGFIPPNGIYGSVQRLDFSFSQTYGQVCFNVGVLRATNVHIQNINADGEWCIKFYDVSNPDGNTEPILSKYVLVQSGSTKFKVGEEDDSGILFRSIGIMSNGCKKLYFNDIYISSWEIYDYDNICVKPRYFPIQTYMEYTTKWFSEYSLKDYHTDIVTSGYDLPINSVTYILRNEKNPRIPLDIVPS